MEERRERVIRLSSDRTNFACQIAWSIISESIGVGKPMILAETCEIFRSFVCWYLLGCDVKCPCAEEIVYSIKERQYYDQIEKAYNFASRLLLDLLMEEKELRARFRYGLTVFIYIIYYSKFARDHYLGQYYIFRHGYHTKTKIGMYSRTYLFTEFHCCIPNVNNR